MRAPLAAAAVLLLLALVTGCGSGSSISGDERRVLTERIADAREASGARDPDGVARAMSLLRRDLRALRKDDKLTKDDAARLYASSIQASRRAKVELTPEPEPTPAPTPAPTVAPDTVAPAAPAAPQGKAKGNGGKAKGKQGEDDED